MRRSSLDWSCKMRSLRGFTKSPSGWEQFFPGCGLDIRRIPDANAVTLGLRTPRARAFIVRYTPGLGLTQVLPLLVAAISAGLHDFLLVENPEVHLHPSGQAAMGEFWRRWPPQGFRYLPRRTAITF